MSSIKILTGTQYNTGGKAALRSRKRTIEGGGLFRYLCVCLAVLSSLGSWAQQKARLITAPHHVILTAPHPSPLSAHRGFFGSRPFSRINAALAEVGETIIDWSNE